MNTKNLLVGIAIAVVLGGCTQEAQQKYSQAGQAASQAAKKTGDALATDAKATGEKIEQSADKAGQATANATRNTGAAISKAAGEVQSKTETSGTAGQKIVRPHAANATDVVAGAGVTGKVKTALLAAPGIDASKINVDTLGNKVVLKGTVRTTAEKLKAAQIAQQQAGKGYQVANHLAVAG